MGSLTPIAHIANVCNEQQRAIVERNTFVTIRRSAAVPRTARCAGFSSCDRNRRTGHEELLLAVAPAPREDGVAGGHVSGHNEREGLVRGISPAVVALWAVAFVARDHVERGAVVDGEGDLAAAAPVVAGERSC